MKTIKTTISLLILGILSSCATMTHFDKLPKPQEFKKPLSQLENEYPDLTKYDGILREFFTSVFDMPEAEPMVEAWDEPHHTRLSWYMLFPPAWIFHPCTVWTWEYEDKIIQARVNRPLALGFKPHVWKLEVEEIEK